jgi:gliding motility-associated-like protein
MPKSKLRLYTVGCILWQFLMLVLEGHAQTSLSIDRLNAYPDNLISVAVRGSFPMGLVTAQGSIHYDTVAITFIRLTNFNPAFGLDLSNFNTTKKGIVSWSWDSRDFKPKVLNPTEPFFEMEFKARGKAGDSASITFANSPTEQIFTDSLAKTIPFTNTNGQIKLIEKPDNNIINGFSPNNDGVNDTWIILGNIGLYPNMEVSVYNVNAEEVFKSSGRYTPWDGNCNGNPLPIGTYYFTLDLR